MSRIEDRELKTPRSTRRQVKEYRNTLLFVVTVLLVTVLLRLFVIGTILVDGESMQPTLHTGEHVVINKLSARLGTPDRYDVVVCRFDTTGEKRYIKRIVAVAGETVQVENGVVLVNGAPLADDVYGDGLRPEWMGPVVVPEGHVFVMGDNRGNSADSCRYGPVDIEKIEGIGFCVIWPLNKLTWL